MRAGSVPEPDAAATEASFVCGSFVSISLGIDRGSSQITDAKYRTNGCGYLAASCEVLIEYLHGRHLQELHGVKHEELIEQFERELEPFPLSRLHCRSIVVDVLKAALTGYRNSLIEEYRGERALICTCFGVDEETIQKCISDNDLTDVDDVVRLCRAGGGCGSCQPLIQEILDAAA